MKLYAALLLPVALLACGDKGGSNAQQPPVAAVAAPAGQDWTQTVAETEEGFVVGNPAAPIKLVEYGARLCPACKAFANEGFEPLMNSYVKTGKVSFEFRDFLIHGPAELGLAAMGRCVDKSAYFPILEETYRNQDTLNQAMMAVPAAQQQALQNGAPGQVVTGWTQAIGGIDFMKQRGLPEAKARQCLADTALLDKITQVTQTAGSNGTVTGTPTLLVNGTKVNGISWAEVERALRQAGA